MVCDIPDVKECYRIELAFQFVDPKHERSLVGDQIDSITPYLNDDIRYRTIIESDTSEWQDFVKNQDSFIFKHSGKNLQEKEMQINIRLNEAEQLNYTLKMKEELTFYLIKNDSILLEAGHCNDLRLVRIEL